MKKTRAIVYGLAACALSLAAAMASADPPGKNEREARKEWADKERELDRERSKHEKETAKEERKRYKEDSKRDERTNSDRPAGYGDVRKGGPERSRKQLERELIL